MRHLLTLFSLLVIATSYGQKKERKKNRKKNKGEITYAMDKKYLQQFFKSLDSTQVEQRVTELLTLPKRGFVKNEWKWKYDTHRSNYTFFRKDTLEEDEDYQWKQSINIEIGSFIRGGNTNLEIPGKVVYDIKYITGKYKDIFYIWQKYFRNDATLDRVLEEYDLTRCDFGHRYAIRFRDIGNGRWSIDLSFFDYN